MAIRGRLDELQASEVLQFLTQSGRSGTLRFQDRHWSKFLAFDNGRLVFALSQHKLPPLTDILYQRGLVESQHVRQTEHRFDDEVTKALEWRKGTVRARTPGAYPRTRLGRILVDSGRITQEALDAVLDPESMPENVLEGLLTSAGAISREVVVDVRKHVGNGKSLHQAILDTGVLSSEQVMDAVECMPEETLAHLLTLSGTVKNNEAADHAEQLVSLRGQSRPVFRIGEYLVACGKVSQRQLERALGAQLTRHCMLGEILVEQGVLTEESIREAEREVAELRMNFSPLRVLREQLVAQHRITREQFAEARTKHLETDKTLAAVLVETGRVAEADLRQNIEAILAKELSDLMLWQEGTYEFFEGYSLADAIGDDGLDRIHSYSFEVSSLLLDAHYRVDELRRGSFRTLGPESILIAANLVASGPTEEISEAELRLLHRMNGQRPIDDVCAVLPGNVLTYLEMMTGFIDKEWAAPLTRADAYEKGLAAVAASDFGQAIAFFEHSLRTPGDEPEAAVLRMCIQDTRVADSRNLLKRSALAVRKGWRYLASRPASRRTADWCARQPVLAKPARGIREGWHWLSTRWNLITRRVALTTQDFMIQKGLARHWWAIQKQVVSPVAGWGAKPAPRVLTIIVVSVTVGIAFMISGVSNLERSSERNGAEVIRGPMQALRSPIKKKWLGEEPLEVAPAMSDEAIFVTSRDGSVRSVPLVGGSKASEWRLDLGEYGDLLSSPTLFGDRLFVTNVRGAVHAISTDGKEVWKRSSFDRVERMAPTMILKSRTQAAGVVVAARESMFVLHPADGRVLFRLQCGNVIEARPVVAGNRIFVGSADNHIYCSDWTTKQVIWDREVGEDVLSLALVEDSLIALVRGGSLVAMRAQDGEEVWTMNDETRRVREIRSLDRGHVGLEMEEGGLRIHDAGTGDLVTAVRPFSNEGDLRLFVSNESYFYYSDRGEIGQVNAAGNHVWRCQENLRKITSLTLRRDTLVATSAEGGVWVFSLRDTAVRTLAND